MNKKQILRSVQIIVLLIVFGVIFILAKGFFDNKAEDDLVNNLLENQHASDSSQGEWVLFTSEEHSFQALFPYEPSDNTEIINIPDAEAPLRINYFTATQIDSTEYVVSSNEYPVVTDARDMDFILESALGGVKRSQPGLNVISSNFDYFDNHRSMDFVISNDDQSLTVEGRLISLENKLYQIFYIVNGGLYNSENAEKFINGFELL